MYEILCRRGKVPHIGYGEYERAAQEVVADIPEEGVILIDDLIERLEIRILLRRLLN